MSKSNAALAPVSATAVNAAALRSVAGILMGSPTRTPWMGNLAFLEHAEPLPATVLLATTGFRNAALRGPNANGNFGFSYSGKHDVQLPCPTANAGRRVYCQVTLNVTGCKGAKPDGAIGAALDTLTLMPRTVGVNAKGEATSAGWYANGKVTIGGVVCQVSLGVWAIGSKADTTGF